MLRALCDSGCQINLMHNDTLQRLRLKKSKSLLQILGLGGIQNAKGKLKIDLHSPIDAEVKVNTECYVTSQLLGTLPQSYINIERWPSIHDLQLADESFHVPGQVDLILGAEFYSKIVQTNIKHFANGPTAQSTSFGWIIFGHIGIPKCNIALANPIVSVCNPI